MPVSGNTYAMPQAAVGGAQGGIQLLDYYATHLAGLPMPLREWAEPIIGPFPRAAGGTDRQADDPLVVKWWADACAEQRFVIAEAMLRARGRRA